LKPFWWFLEGDTSLLHKGAEEIAKLRGEAGKGQIWAIYRGKLKV